MRSHPVREELGCLATPPETTSTYWDLFQTPPDVGPADDCRRIDYLPTPREIADACAAIRSTWTPSEKRRRFVGDEAPDEIALAWWPPVIDTSHFRASGSGVRDSVR